MIWILGVNYWVQQPKLRKQRDADKNNSRENGLRIHHDYQVGDKVLITSSDIHRTLNCPTKGPKHIVQVYPNSIVHVQTGAITEHINIKCRSPYADQHKFWGGMICVHMSSRCKISLAKKLTYNTNMSCLHRTIFIEFYIHIHEYLFMSILDGHSPKVIIDLIYYQINHRVIAM